MTKGANSKSLGEYIKARRQSHGLSFNDCAEHSGLHHTYWRKLEQGEYERPDPTNLQLVAETLSCPLEDLYSLCGYPVPTELPTLTPYLRSKYAMPPEAVADMEKYFTQLRSYYGIPVDEPVFPPAERSDGQAERPPSGSAKNAPTHPWRREAA